MTLLFPAAKPEIPNYYHLLSRFHGAICIESRTRMLSRMIEYKPELELNCNESWSCRAEYFFFCNSMAIFLHVSRTHTRTQSAEAMKITNNLRSFELITNVHLDACSCSLCHRCSPIVVHKLVSLVARTENYGPQIGCMRAHERHVWRDAVERDWCERAYLFATPKAKWSFSFSNFLCTWAKREIKQCKIRNCVCMCVSSSWPYSRM